MRVISNFRVESPFVSVTSRPILGQAKPVDGSSKRYVSRNDETGYSTSQSLFALFMIVLSTGASVP